MALTAPGDQALDAVTEAAREAGRIAMRHFRSGHATWQKGPGQIVTAADIEIDHFLRDALPGIVPAAWMSEETEDDPARLEADRLWIVDPIDGTRSFAEGKPEFAVSIALVEQRAPVFAIVFNPALDQLFSAIRGKGTRLDGRPVRARSHAGLDGAEIVVSQTEDRRRRFTEWFPQAHVTVIGSLAYKLARVAAGHFDAYFSWRRSHDWDIAAAMLLLAEAGATLSDAHGRPIMLNAAEPTQDGLIAACGKLHGALVARSIERRD